MIKKFTANHYELNCVLIDAVTEKVLVHFNARAIDEKKNAFDYVGVGVASYNQNYTVVTNAKELKGFAVRPMVHAVLLNGAKYVINGLRSTSKTPIGGSFYNSKKLPESEIIMELQ